MINIDLSEDFRKIESFVYQMKGYFKEKLRNAPGPSSRNSILEQLEEIESVINSLEKLDMDICVLINENIDIKKKGYVQSIDNTTAIIPVHGGYFKVPGGICYE